MKKLFGVCIVALSVMCISSCKKKADSTIIITEKQPIIIKDAKPKKMGDYKQSRAVEWIGNRYTIETQLAAVDSLPLAADGATKYYDNRITLRIVRADGTDFFKKTFTKTYFKEYVDDIYYKDGAMLGIVFDKVEGNTLVFAASVGNPDKSSDEYVPLVLKIDNFGNVSVSKDTNLDTDVEQSEEEEDGV